MGLEGHVLPLMLHHPLGAPSPEALAWPHVHAAMEERGGGPVLQAVGAHAEPAQHGQGPALGGAADLIAAGDLHTQQV